MNTYSATEKSSFSKIYLVYFPKLVRFAREYVISTEDAENIVQDIFMYLWEHRDMLDSLTNTNAFLFTLTKNRCIDFYRQKTRIDSQKESLDNLQDRELKLKIEALMQFDENIFTEKEVEFINEELGIAVADEENDENILEKIWEEACEFEIYESAKLKELTEKGRIAVGLVTKLGEPEEE